METQKELRKHLLELLEGKSAHIDLETAINKFPLDKINIRLGNSPHSAWQLLEHIRIAQWDIVEFSLDEKHKSPKFPDEYWIKEEGTEKSWKESCKEILKDLQRMRDLVSDEKTDLFAKIPHGDGQTIFREAMLIADHNAYHLGEMIFLMKAL